MAIVLRPQGKLDLMGAAALQQKVERVAALAPPTQKTWIIDLEEVNFINHFGLTTLMVARRQARQRGCRLVLRNLRSPVQLMLDIAELTDEFEILNPEINTGNLPEDGLSEQQSQGKSALNTEVGIEPNQEGDPDIDDVGDDSSVGNLQKILANFRSRFNQE